MDLAPTQEKKDMSRAFRMCVTSLLFSISLSVAPASRAAEIKVVAANAVKLALVELTADFEKSTGHKVALAWGGTTGITRQIARGRIVDLVIVSSTNIDRLIGQGKLAKGSRVDFARSGVGVAVRAGLPKPDISTVAALKNAILDAKAIAYSSGPSGYYIASLLKKLGIAEQVKDRVRQPPSGAQVADLLIRREADLAFQQISELQHAKGIVYLGPLPPEVQETTVYSIGRHTAAPAAEQAAIFARYLTAPGAAAAIRRMGMDPR